jgi:hypothetical protein
VARELVKVRLILSILRQEFGDASLAQRRRLRVELLRHRVGHFVRIQSDAMKLILAVELTRISTDANAARTEIKTATRRQFTQKSNIANVNEKNHTTDSRESTHQQQQEFVLSLGELYMFPFA